MAQHPGSNGVVHAPRSRIEEELTGPEPLTRGYRPSYSTEIYSDPHAVFLWRVLFDVPSMLRHPAVYQPLDFYKGGVGGAEFKVEASNQEAADWYLDQLERFWTVALGMIQESYAWGWGGYEVMYREEKHRLHFDKLEDFNPRDVVPLSKEGRYVGVRVKGTGTQDHHGRGRNRDLWGPRRTPSAEPTRPDVPPKAFWYAHCPAPGQKYFGRTQLWSAWLPWKRLTDPVGGAEIVTDMAIYRFGVAGPLMRYPTRDTLRPNSNDRDSARDRAMEFVEQAKSGAGVALPSTRDENGNPDWDIEWPDHTISVDPLLNYSSKLEDQISAGIGVPKELMEASDTGSGYSGRAIPMEAFLMRQQRIAEAIVFGFCQQVLDPLLLWNFGRTAWARATVKPLIETKAKQAGGGQQGMPPGAQPPAPPAGAPPGAPGPQGPPSGGAGPGGGAGGDPLAALLGGAGGGGGAQLSTLRRRHGGGGYADSTLYRLGWKQEPTRTGRTKWVGYGEDDGKVRYQEKMPGAGRRGRQQQQPAATPAPVKLTPQQRAQARAQAKAQKEAARLKEREAAKKAREKEKEKVTAKEQAAADVTKLAKEVEAVRKNPKKLTGEWLVSFAERMGAMTGQQLADLKKTLGVKASGTKSELARKIEEKVRGAVKPKEKSATTKKPRAPRKKVEQPSSGQPSSFSAKPPDGSLEKEASDGSQVPVPTYRRQDVPADFRAVPDEEQLLRDAAELAQEVRRRHHGVLSVPALYDALADRHPDLTEPAFHRQLIAWAARDLVSPQIVNDTNAISPEELRRMPSWNTEANKVRLGIDEPTEVLGHLSDFRNVSAAASPQPKQPAAPQQGASAPAPTAAPSPEKALQGHQQALGNKIFDRPGPTDYPPGITETPGDFRATSADPAALRSDITAAAQEIGQGLTAAPLGKIYDAVRAKHPGLTVEDFQKTVAAMHNSQNQGRLTGWPKTPEELPDPDKAITYNGKLMGFFRPSEGAPGRQGPEAGGTPGAGAAPPSGPQPAPAPQPQAKPAVPAAATPEPKLAAQQQSPTKMVPAKDLGPALGVKVRAKQHDYLKDHQVLTFASPEALAQAVPNLWRNGWVARETENGGKSLVVYPAHRRDMPEVAYHIVPRDALDQILRTGLRPTQGDSRHHESLHSQGKVFLHDDPKALAKLAARLGEEPDAPEYVMLRVDTNRINAPAWKDMMDGGGAFFLHGATVPPEALSLANAPAPSTAPATRPQSAPFRPEQHHDAALAAIRSLDRRGNGVVDVADVRDALARQGLTDRGQQDAVLNSLRKAGRIGGAAYEGRTPISDRQRAAVLPDPGNPHGVGRIQLREEAGQSGPPTAVADPVRHAASVVQGMYDTAFDPTVSNEDVTRTVQDLGAKLNAAQLQQVAKEFGIERALPTRTAALEAIGRKVLDRKNNFARISPQLMYDVPATPDPATPNDAKPAEPNYAAMGSAAERHAAADKYQQELTEWTHRNQLAKTYRVLQTTGTDKYGRKWKKGKLIQE